MPRKNVLTEFHFHFTIFGNPSLNTATLTYPAPPVNTFFHPTLVNCAFTVFVP